MIDQLELHLHLPMWQHKVAQMHSALSIPLCISKPMERSHHGLTTLTGH